MNILSRVFIFLMFCFLLCCNSGFKSNKPTSDSEVVGHFDLKSACLNLSSPINFEKDVCEMPFSKSLETNSESQLVKLNFCNGQLKNSCLEPFQNPTNNPPETIKIRDKNSNLISSWGKVKTQVEIADKTKNTAIKPLVIEITEIKK
ncbi:MAG: hypothetical protein LUM44_13960 [Pyrinomonadaceae bacterium]|nr:hypothetical protein [Pyrinomonadaceae bacterium]